MAMSALTHGIMQVLQVNNKPGWSWDPCKAALKYYHYRICSNDTRPCRTLFLECRDFAFIYFGPSFLRYLSAVTWKALPYLLKYSVMSKFLKVNLPRVTLSFRIDTETDLFYTSFCGVG